MGSIIIFCPEGEFKQLQESYTYRLWLMRFASGDPREDV